MMRIKYTNSFGDIARFLWYHQLHNPIVMWFLGIVSVSVSVYSADWSIEGWFPYILAGTMSILGFAFMLLLGFLFGLVDMYSKHNKAMLQDHEITIDENGVTEKTVSNTMENTWGAVTKFVVTKRYILIYLTKHMAHVIPLAAFSNSDDREDFIDLCVEYFENS